MGCLGSPFSFINPADVLTSATIYDILFCVKAFVRSIL